MTSQCSQFVVYHWLRKSKDGMKESTLKGCIDDKRPGYLFEWIDYNKFAPQSIPIPPEYTLHNMDPDFIRKVYYDPQRILLTKKDPGVIALRKMSRGKRSFLTLSNDSRPFRVLISKTGTVDIYKQPESHFFIREADWSAPWTYIEPWASYPRTVRIMIGKSPKNSMTEFSGGFGRSFYGNSLLIQLTKSRYVFVGAEIFEFSVPKGEIIEEFFSPVGNNDFPYPFAFSQNYIYSFPLGYIPKEAYPHKLTHSAKLKINDYFWEPYKGFKDGFVVKNFLRKKSL